MRVTLKPDALELDEQRTANSPNFTFEHQMWRETVSELLAIGGEFEVNTSWLALDNFTIYHKDVGSIELPDYMIDSVIDDERISNCVNVTIKPDALELNEARLPSSELVTSEYKHWHKSMSKALKVKSDFDVKYHFDGKYFIIAPNNEMLPVHECMIESSLMTDRV
ncbi:hypothetical protein [Vibrio owensii]|uniref:hypothetical protein n=1 Tax=Vibrio owensii TaxID=696485 RepID=UPI003CC6597D